jgi:YjbR
MTSIDELRRFVLSFDGACEASHQGKPDFRYRNRIVVNLDEAARSITIKLPLDEQAALIDRNDGACSLPGGWAKHGWTTLSLDRFDDEELRELITQAWTDTTSPRIQPPR